MIELNLQKTVILMFGIINAFIMGLLLGSTFYNEITLPKIYFCFLIEAIFFLASFVMAIYYDITFGNK